MKHTYIIGILTVLVLVAIFLFSREAVAPIPTYVATSTPDNTSTSTATSTITDSAAHSNIIVVDSPVEGGVVTSPLTVTGKARGSWYYEASFPIDIVDWDGRIIASGTAQAEGDWMTTDFVPFTATLSFAVPTTTSDIGAVILHKDNPSGLPQNDDALEVPIHFMSGSGTSQGTGSTTGSVACTLDARQCPDGSYVSRVGPDCHFAQCPTTIAPFHSGIRGTVMIGPTCPVVRQDLNCADKPLVTDISITHKNATSPFFNTRSDEEGAFAADIPPGDYVVTAHSSSTLPRCTPQTVTVDPDTYSMVDITCDSGIR